MKVEAAVPGTGSPRVARALKRARQRKGLTQEQAAAGVGVTTGTYCSWETARHGIRVGRLKIVAEFFGLQVAELVA